METAAPDFRIFWDNAYAVHHLTDSPAKIADVLALCAENGHPDRAFVFGSSSKITFAGAGVAFFGSSPANLEWWLSHTVQAEHRSGQDQPAAARAVPPRRRRAARAHADAGRGDPAQVRRGRQDPDRRARRHRLASWTNPAGGYFISLQVPEGCAREVVAKAKAAGIAITPAGATHPYGDDPTDQTIRHRPHLPRTPRGGSRDHRPRHLRPPGRDREAPRRSGG
jgi:DNA-binding transcriptional MocR family regulator